MKLLPSFTLKDPHQTYLYLGGYNMNIVTTLLIVVPEFERREIGTTR